MAVNLIKLKYCSELYKIFFNFSSQITILLITELNIQHSDRVVSNDVINGSPWSIRDNYIKLNPLCMIDDDECQVYVMSSVPPLPLG